MSEHETQDGDRAFERRAQELFDASVAGLDAATRSRLNQARHRALAAAGPVRHNGWWTWAPSGAIVAALLAIGVVLWQPGADLTAEGGLRAASIADLEVLLGEEDLEMLDEEIEFYAWLEQQPEFTPEPKGDGVG
jgi:hypothetical protein